jgi:hypothetical protein
VLGGFAVGAAVTFAPLASADPTEITTTVDSEIASLNSLFTGEAALAGDTVTTNGTNTFDTVPLVDAPDSGTPTTLDYELYGVSPIAQAGSDPGAYDLFNGALGKFDDALNIELYSLENGGAIDPNAADFFGTASSITTGLDSATATDAAEYFYNFGIGDLSGFFDTNLSFLDIGSAI